LGTTIRRFLAAAHQNGVKSKAVNAFNERFGTETEGRGAITTIPGTLTKRKTFFYTLSLPISTAIIGCDSVAQVEECVELARSFTPLSQAQMAALEAKVEPVAKQALFFRLMPR
jgi:hypothetical protein